MYNSNVSIGFLGDGETREFNFIFNIFKEEYLDVYVNKELKTSGYKIISINNFEGGGIVFFDKAPNYIDEITIVRNLPIKRTTDFKEGGPFRASRVNGEFDYQIGCLEQLEEKLSRSILKPVYINDNIDLSLPEPSVGKAIIWDSNGKSLKNSAINVDDLTIDIKTISDLADKSTEAADVAFKSSREVINKASIDLDNLSEIGKNSLSENIDLGNIKPENAHKLIGNRIFQSEEYTWTSGTVLNINHNLNMTKTEQDNMQIELISVMTKAIAGWSVGDKIRNCLNYFQSGTYFEAYFGTQFQATENSVKIPLGSGFLLSEKTGGYGRDSANSGNSKLVIMIKY